MLAACFLLLWAVGDRGLWAAEGRWAEINREMFLTGDFFHPTINGDPYFDKPLLTYWLISLVSAFSGTLNEWTVRIPGALAGLGAVWATMRLGRRLWSRRTGLIGGWFLLTGYGFLFWSRTATAESENLFAIVLCVAWYWARRGRWNFGSFLVFWLIAFLGALTKGLTAVIVPVLAIAPDLLRERRWRTWLSPAQFLALGLAAAVYLAPFIYASLTRPEYGESGLTLVFEENILRYFKPFDHKDPIYVYLYQIPLLFLPWTPLFLAAVAGTLTGWKHLDEKTRWLIQAAALIFLFFTLSGSRRSYYILPIFPFCALWTAVFTVHLTSGGLRLFRQWGIRVQAILAGILAAGAVILPPLWVLFRGRVAFIPPPVLLPVILALGLGATALGLASFRATRSSPRTLPALIGMMAVLLGGYFCFILPALDIYRTERAFGIELGKKTAGIPPDKIAFYPDVRSNMIFYLDKEHPVRVFDEDDEEELQAFLAATPGAVLVAKRRYEPRLRPLFPPRRVPGAMVLETVYPWEKKRANGRRAAWFFPGK